MELSVKRQIHTQESTIGFMYVNGERECYTLEDVEREEKVYGKTAIPKGTYNIIINFSPKYKKNMIMLEDVEGFSGVRIHSGNVAEDTDGCILVGTTIGDNRVNNSGIAMRALYEKVSRALETGEKVTLTIT